MPEIAIALPKWHDKQRAVFDSKASEVLFAGDTRSGKSFFVRKSYIIYCSQIPGLQCDIFRVNFDDVIANYMDGETSFPALLHEWEKEKLCRINQTEIVFWNESRISLEHCSDDKVMRKHQGISKHVRTLDESTQIPEHRIRALSGWVTMSAEMLSRVPEKWKGKFPLLIHITNPWGVSASYYRRVYVEAHPPYSLWKHGPFQAQYIPAFVEDNPSEDEETTRERIREAFPDSATQAALLAKDRSGITNWQTSAGSFFPEWNFDRHVVSDFTPPKHWFRYRTFDWGTADPGVCYWIAVSDGEPFKDSQGTERWFPRGARIFFQEWYIADPQRPSQGLRLRNEEMAQGIVDRTEYEFKHNLITLTDSFPFADRGGETIAQIFAKNGCPLSLGDTSRAQGWAIMRAALIGKEIDTNTLDDLGQPKRYPLVYFCSCCKYATDYIPALGRHPSDTKREDAQEHGEPTHACDAIRLGLTAHTVIKDHLAPIDTRIQKEVSARRPTIKSITKSLGYNYLR